MPHLSLRARASAFAVAAGSLVFILAVILGAASAQGSAEALINAIVLAIICGVISWAATMRSVTETAGAIDQLVDRILEASHGELGGNLDVREFEELPALVMAINRLLDRVRTSITNFQDLALRDAVTGLPNRVQLRREAERLLRDRLNDDPMAALLFIDLDRFKTVNDTLGHAHGDYLLAQVAVRIGEAIGAEALPRDMVPPIAARLAGDEFTILVPAFPDMAWVDRFSRRILDTMAAPFELSGQVVEIGASIGVACCPADGRDLTQLMKNADIAMYHAKASGRGQVQFFSAELKARSEGRRVLERQLKQALISREFELFVQPQVNAADGAVIAGEALIRWRHPELGMRLPANFIALAEESGLIIEIGDWVTDAVAALLGDWHRRGLRQRLTFNVSSRQLERQDFFVRLEEAMARSDGSWSQLELEVTETLVMRSEPQTIGRLADLRAKGASIAIDDFGTGYSNLARLRQLPVNRIKIDRSIIADIGLSAQARTIAQAIVGLAHGLGCEVVAEGVETSIQAGILRVMGCDILQGYAIAEAMETSRFPAWVEQARNRTQIPS